MKTYEDIINETRYWYFYDTNIKSWTVFKVDDQNYQVGNAEHYANKKSLLKDYKFNFKKTV
jgi:hypothetical protein